MNTRSIIEDFLLNKLAVPNSPRTIDPDESLFSLGILDSLAFLQLILFLQEQFQVTVEDGEVIPDNFDTIHRIEQFLATKAAG
jgi:acyl carrier protein